LPTNLREVLRVLKPGGRLIIIAEVYKGSEAFTAKAVERYSEKTGMALLSVEEHRGLLTDAGCSDVQVITKPRKGWICCMGSKPAVSLPHGGGEVQKVRINEKLAAFSDHWNPKVVGELNGQQVKLVKFQGDFVWHHHEKEDELFLVVHGAFRMDYRDEAGRERSLELSKGEFVIVPRGVEHRPSAAEEVHVLLFEPASTLNTGNLRNERTVGVLEKL
jgi:mannose-6-phosphate isomerase-like protein (cupin superfamily)